ncbi:MAG: diguanylate cyclase [Pseudomonadota bacterium]
MDGRIDRREAGTGPSEDTAPLHGTDVFKALTPRDFLTLSDQEVRRASRYSRPLSVVMIQLNDVPELIEKEGTDVARKVALAAMERVGMMMRETDLMSHLGPAEIGLLLPETRLEQAYIAALRLRMAFSEVMLETLAGPRFLSICAGVAAISPRTRNAKTFLMQACVELRRARSEGPGTVCAAAPDTSRVVRPGTRAVH